MLEFRKVKPNVATNLLMLDNIDRMHEFANERYTEFSKIWTQFDEAAFACGIVIAFWLFYFHSVTSFGISQQEQTTAGIVGFGISAAAYAVA